VRGECEGEGDGNGGIGACGGSYRWNISLSQSANINSCTVQFIVY